MDVEIIKTKKILKKSIHLAGLTSGFQSFRQNFFGNIQGTFFNLSQLLKCVLKKYYKRNNSKSQMGPLHAQVEQ
jgi:hypothetical protein